MTDFQFMLQLFINGATGIKTDIDASYNIECILKTAYEHNMYYSVLSALLACEDNELNLSAEKIEKLRKDLKNVRLRTYVRMMQLSEILKQFESKDIISFFFVSPLGYLVYSRVQKLFINK